MLSYQNIKTIATYERKTLYRTWFFKIFAIIALLGLGGFHLITTLVPNANDWAIHALPANMPYVNIKFLNIIQSIIAIFLASGFLKKDKQLDTSVVIYVRPMSNVEYVIGKTLGVFRLFMGLNILSLLFTFIMNIVAIKGIPDIVPYIIYPLLISVPSLIFIFGLAFVCMSFVKNQSITFLLLLGYVVTCVIYLGSRMSPIFDYTSFHLPLLYSDIVGFSNLTEVLLHRGGYLLIGIGLIFLTIVKIDRLANSPKKIKRYLLISLLCIISGVFCLSEIWLDNVNSLKKKTEFASINNEYFNTPTVDFLKNDISLLHEGESISCTVNLEIINNNKKDLNRYIISLNPGLIIESIKCNSTDLKFSRKENIIEIEDNISVKEQKTISIKYSGGIDERVCFADVSEKLLKEKLSYYNLIVPKKYSFLESHYLFLTPESNWYPTAGFAYNPQKPSIGRYKFSNYSLKVKTKEGLTAISQGNMQKLEDGTFFFKTEKPLTQISLMIGDYEKQEIKVDSIIYSIHFKKGHDYYTPVFEGLKDTLPSLIKAMMSDYELKQNRNYPYKRLTIVEAPVSFYTYNRLWTSHQETVQPEIIFVPELGFTLPQGDFAKRFSRTMKWRSREDENVKEKDIRAEIFSRQMYNIFQTDEKANKIVWNNGENAISGTDINTKVYSIYPNFYTFTNNIYSKEYPIIGGIIENLTKDESQGRGSRWMEMLGGITPQEKANLILDNKKLEDILEDAGDYEEDLSNIMQNKADFLKALITGDLNKKQLRKTLTDFYKHNMYKSVDINSLLKLLKTKYNIDIQKQMEQWYKSSKIPGYKLEDVESYTVKDGENQKYQIKIRIANLEDVDGIVNIKVRTKGGKGGRKSRAKRQASALEFSYYLKANTSYEIGILTTKKPVVFTANTVVSKNIPAKITKRFESFEESKEQAFSGIRKVEIKKNDNIIIVDNEDKEFKLIENIQEKALKKYLSSTKKEAKDKYKSMRPWNPPSRWSLFTKDGQYGKYIRSAYYAHSNENNKKAVWTANIKKDGYYEVYFFYNTNTWTYGKRGSKKNNSTIYNLNIIAEGETTNVELDLDGDNDKGWFSLGYYYFSKGKAKVELTDNSGSRSIVADAVKWIKKD
ncbi:MAG: hypothetical protein WBG43_11615 [Marinifilaceae bacterium]